MWIKVIDKLLHRRLIVNSFVRLDCIVPVHESYQFNLSVPSVFENRLGMPLLHEGSREYAVSSNFLLVAAAGTASTAFVYE